VHNVIVEASFEFFATYWPTKGGEASMASPTRTLPRRRVAPSPISGIPRALADWLTRHGESVAGALSGTLHACDHVTITTIRDSDGYQQSIIVLARSGGLYWRLHGDAVASVPLRHRSTNGAPSTRIVESAMRWRTDDGVSLCGMAEYLDQLDDGQPVGLHV